MGGQKGLSSAREIWWDGQSNDMESEYWVYTTTWLGEVIMILLQT